MTSSIKFAFASTLVAAATLGATSASALTLNTAGLKANAVLQFSVAASGSTQAAGVTIGAAGTVAKLADAAAVDTRGNPVSVPVFNLPVTKVDVSIGSKLNIIPNYGLSTGAALRLATPALGGDAVLANFRVDFKTKIVSADLIDVFEKTTVTNIPLYTFEEVKPQVVSLKGLVLNQKNFLGKLVFVPSVIEPLGNALLIDPVLRASLSELDWGTINVEVTSFKRSPAVSTKPFTLANVQ